MEPENPLMCSSYTFFFLWRCGPTQVMASSFLMFLDHTQWCTTVGGTPLGEWSACRRDLYLTTHNTCDRQTSMPPVGFEPTISAGERLQTYALDRAATGTGVLPTLNHPFLSILHFNTSFTIILLSMFSYFYWPIFVSFPIIINPLNPELIPICYLLALLGAHHFFHVSRIRVKLLTFRLLMSYMYGASILDVSRSHTTTQHSR